MKTTFTQADVEQLVNALCAAVELLGGIADGKTYGMLEYHTKLHEIEAAMKMVQERAGV